MPETPTATASHVLADPSAAAVAKVYAQSYLNAASAVGVEQPLELIQSYRDEVMNAHPEFARLLHSELTTREEKLGIIERVIQPRASEFFTNFLKVLARHDRLELLPLIIDEARDEQERREGKRRVMVRSALPLNEEQRQALQDRLASFLPFQPILVVETDESLLGGLVIQVGDTVYDGSIQARLKDLKHRLRERYLNEIQSGRNRFSAPEGD